MITRRLFLAGALAATPALAMHLPPRLLRPQVRAEGGRFPLSGDVQMKIWDDQSRDWTGLQAPPWDGSTLRHESTPLQVAESL